MLIEQVKHLKLKHNGVAKRQSVKLRNEKKIDAERLMKELQLVELKHNSGSNSNRDAKCVKHRSRLALPHARNGAMVLTITLLSPAKKTVKKYLVIK